MDLHGTLSALMRPVTAVPPATFPLTSFLQHPLMSSLALPLAANHMDPTTLFDLTVTDPQATVTPKKTRLDSPSSPLSQSSTVSSTQLSSPQPSPVRKLAKPIPDEKKDEAYYERRRRNNDAAKRSRDARRIKEEAIAARAAQLERENGQLRAQVAVLKSETARLQLLLFSRQHLTNNNIKTELKTQSMTDTVLENTAAAANVAATAATVLHSDMEIKQ